MADRMSTHANERLDLVDAIQIATTFPGDQQKELVLRALLTDLPGGKVLDGFRLRVDNPLNGQVTVVNGVAVDRDGQIVLDDESYTKSKTVTMTANSTNYIAVRFRLDDVDVDARAFMDPTYDNGLDPSGDPRPAGREFTISVPTRSHPAWEVIVNTIGFPFWTDWITGNRSLEVPLGAVVTNVANQITGVTYETARSTVIDYTYAAAPNHAVGLNTARQFTIGNNVQVVDPTTGAILGGPYPITAVDFDNNVIQATGIAAAGLAYGQAVQETTASTLVKLNTANDATYRPFGQQNTPYFQMALARFTDPDAPGPAAPIVYANDAVTELPTARTPEHIKDEGSFIETLLATIREMKFGNAAAIAAGTRWADFYQVGQLDEVYQARIHPDGGANIPTWHDGLEGRTRANQDYFASIGDGVNTFGDFNGAAEIEDLIIWLNAQELLGTTFNGRVIVKEGVYDCNVWASAGATIRLPSGILWEGTHREKVTLTNLPTFVLTNVGGYPLVTNNAGFKELTLETSPEVGPGTGRLPLMLCAAEEASRITVDTCIVRAGGYNNATATHFGALHIDGAFGTEANNFVTIHSLFDMQEGGYGCYFGPSTTCLLFEYDTFNWYDLGLTSTQSGLWVAGDEYWTGRYDYRVDNCRFLGAPANGLTLGHYQCAMMGDGASGMFVRRNIFDATPYRGSIGGTIPRLIRQPIANMFGLGIATQEGLLTVEENYFGSLEIGIVSYGVNTINANTFESCNVGIHSTTGDSIWGTTPLELEATNNKFLNCGHITGAINTHMGSVGIVLLGSAGAVGTNVNIRGNLFEGQNVAIYGDAGAAGSVGGAIQELNIEGNKFHDILGSAISFEEGWTEDHDLTNADKFGVQNLNVISNEFVRCCLNPANTNFTNCTYATTNALQDRWYIIRGSAKDWNIEGNEFYRCMYEPTVVDAGGDNALIFNETRLASFRFTDNKVRDSWPRVSGASFYYGNIGVGVDAIGPIATNPNMYIDIDIQNNTFDHTEPVVPPPGAYVTPDIEGFRFYPACDWSTVAGALVHPIVDGYVLRGHFCDNEMRLVNGNSAFYVYSLYTATLFHCLQTGDFDFSHNEIINNVDSNLGAASCYLIRTYCFGSTGQLSNNDQFHGDGLKFIGNKFRIFNSTPTTTAYPCAGFCAIHLPTYPGHMTMKGNTFANCVVKIESVVVAVANQGDYDVQFDIDISQNQWDIDQAGNAFVAYCLWLQTVVQLPNAAYPIVSHRNAMKINDNTFRYVNDAAFLPENQRAVYIAGADPADLPDISGATSLVQMHSNQLLNCRHEWNGSALANWTNMAGAVPANPDLHFNYSFNQMNLYAGLNAINDYSHWGDIGGGGGVGVYARSGCCLLCVGNTNDDAGVMDQAPVGVTGDGM